MVISVGGKQDCEAVGRMLVLIAAFLKNWSLSFLSPLKCTKLQLTSWILMDFFCLWMIVLMKFAEEETSSNSRFCAAYVKWSRSVVSASATPWTVAYHAPPSVGFPGKNTGVGCHFLLQGIVPTQGSNPSLPHCRQTLYLLSHQGIWPQNRYLQWASFWNTATSEEHAFRMRVVCYCFL